jgi:hypothetical protein
MPAAMVFALPEPPPGVLPSGVTARKIAQDAKVALDSAGAIQINSWAAQQVINGSIANGQAFMGYTLLSEMAQRPEFRRLSEVLAVEMTRKWIKLQAAKKEQAESKADKIRELVDELDRLDVRGAFRKVAELDGFFGVSHLYLDTGATENRPELVTSIGNGRDAASKLKFKGKTGFLRAVKPVEPVWCYPAKYNANDPLKDDWYNPQSWFCLSKEIDRSRLLTFVGREVPDMLKPAYMFGGLSLSQLARPYVENWLRTRQSVADLIWTFSITVLKTDLSTLGAEDGDQLFKRLALFSNFRTNQGTMLINKESEEVENVATPLSGLDLLQSQAQEHMCVSGDTLIETDRGQLPIRDVTADDKVMTRAGYAPIEWVGCTGFATKLVEIETARSTLKVTECHPLFLPKTNEFASAKNVRIGDLLLEAQTWPTSMVSPFYGEVVGGERPRPATIETSKGAASYIAKSGRRITGLFQKASTYITATKTRLTTTLRTLNSSLTPITWPSTWSAVALASTGSQFPSTRTAPLAASPIAQFFRKGLSTAVRIANRRPIGASAAYVVETSITRRLVSFVAANSRPVSLSRIPGFTAVRRAPTECTTAVVVRAVREIEASEPVYNLSVRAGHLPEFFANGILTHNCSVSGTPVVKLLGIQPAGLNASSQGELTTWYDWVAAFQEKLFRPNLTKVIDFVQLSLWGEVDPDITFVFEPLQELTEKELAEKRKVEADTDTALIESGVITTEESRTRLAAEPEGPYAGIEIADGPSIGLGEEGDLEGQDGPDLGTALGQLGATEGGVREERQDRGHQDDRRESEGEPSRRAQRDARPARPERARARARAPREAATV